MTHAHGSPPRADGSRLGEEAQELLRAVFAEALSLKMGEVAEQVRSEAARASVAKASLVVVGETKRGKSSVINALLRSPNLSPVDVDVTTSAFIEFRHGPAPAARVFRLGSDQPVPTGLDELSRWATVSGNPGNVAGVQKVEVDLAVPLLERLNLIDTPGVGGLVAGHADIVLLALARATALLFVVDPNAPLGEPELRFLARATERFDTVLFAMTKTDQYPNWRRILDADRELLRRRAPRFANCPVIGVSTVMAQRALRLATERPDLHDRLWAESGMAALESSIRSEVVDRAAALGQANAVRFAGAALAHLERSLLQTVATATGDPAVRAALEREQARLKDLSKENASWGPKLQHRVTRLRIEQLAELARGVDELATQYDERIPRLNKQQLEELPTTLDADFGALAARTAESLALRVEGIARDLLGDLVEKSGLPDTLEALEQLDPLVSGAEPGPTEAGPRTMLDHYGEVNRAFSGHSLAMFLSGLLGLGFGPTALLTGGLGLLGFVARKKKGASTEWRAWARARLQSAHGELKTTLELKIVDAHNALAEEMREYVAARSDEIKTNLEAHKRSLVEQQKRDVQVRAAAEQHLSTVRGLASRAETLLAVLGNGERSQVGASP